MPNERHALSASYPFASPPPLLLLAFASGCRPTKIAEAQGVTDERAIWCLVSGVRRLGGGVDRGAGGTGSELAGAARQGQLADRRRRPAEECLAAERDADHQGKRPHHAARLEGAARQPAAADAQPVS